MHALALKSGLLSLVVMTLASPLDAAAVDAFDFGGSITDVGVQRGPGQVGGVEFRIRGKFVLDQPLDLTRANVVLEALFVDDASGGLGELMTTVDDAAVVPLALVARDSNRPDNAVFDQPQAYRPVVRLQIQNRNGAYEFRLKLDRGLMRRRPLVCEENLDASHLPITPITHGLLIDDGVNPPVEVLTTQLWECTKPGRYHMRATGTAVQGGPTSSPIPTATPSPTTTATPSPTTTGTPSPTTTATPSPTTTGTPSPTTTPSTTPLPTPTPFATPSAVPSSPPHANLPPTASLRSNRVASVPGEIELDGRDSADRDGKVVRYHFESGDGRVQDGPDATARFVYAPGDYRAALVVFDDQGAASEPTTRGFSVKH